MNARAESRWVGAGRASDPAAAIAEAVDGRDPALVVVFGDRAPGAIGCATGAAHIEAFALGGPGFDVATAHVEAPPGGLREAGAAAASCLAGLAPLRHRVLVVLSSGIAGDNQDLVRGIYSVAGASVPIVGGSTGGRPLFHGDAEHGQGLVVAAIASEAPFGIGVRHGWHVVGEGMIVTASSGTVVETVDDRPALDVYIERMEVPAEVRHDADRLASFARMHPLAIPTRGVEPQLRLVVATDLDRRTFSCSSDMPAGTVAWPTAGDSRSVLAAAEAACDDALGGDAPLGLLAFRCQGRRAILGDEHAAREGELIDRRAGGAAVATLETYGEYARVHGVAGFHAHAMAVLALK